MSKDNVVVLDIPLTQIVADRARNCRSFYDQQAQTELTESMKANGQMSACEVEATGTGKDQRYVLNIGFRRYTAAVTLGWTTLKCEVVSSKDGRTRKLRQLAENMARSNLTKYDQAREFSLLKNGGKDSKEAMKAAVAAASCGVSVSYFNNLCRVWESVEPCILKRWRDEEAPTDPNATPLKQVCTMDWLTHCAANVPRAEQEAHLLRALGMEGGATDGDTTEREPQAPGAPKRASSKELERALEAAQAASKTRKDAASAMAIAVLEFAIGKTTSIEGIYTGTRQVK